jgi:hypothetical protein
MIEPPHVVSEAMIFDTMVRDVWVPVLFQGRAVS